MLFSGGSIDFEASATDPATVELVVSRDPTSTGQAVVQLATSGSAQPGVDYEAVPDSITFDEGEFTKSLQIRSIDRVASVDASQVLVVVARFVGELGELSNVAVTFTGDGPATAPAAAPVPYTLTDAEKAKLNFLDPEMGKYLADHPEITITRPDKVRPGHRVAGHTEGNTIPIERSFGEDPFVETLIHELLHHQMGRPATRAEHMDIYRREADAIIKNGRGGAYGGMFIKDDEGHYHLNEPAINRAIDQENAATQPSTTPGSILYPEDVA